MGVARILHVDDEPDVREVVRLSLEVDPEMTVRSCASGTEALLAAAEWSPDLVILGMEMPNMEAPATLARLHRDRATAMIPVVFMASEARTREPGYFRALGALGVLSSPFDPGKLAEDVRRFLKPRASGQDASKEEFLDRAEGYANELLGCIKALVAGANREDELVHVRQIAHRLASTNGIRGLQAIRTEAEALDEKLMQGAADSDIRGAIDLLLARISAASDEKTFTQAATSPPPKPRAIDRRKPG